MTDDLSSNVPPIEDWNRLLDGRVAVVTGGGGGIGRAISELFARHGAHVELIDIDPDSARATEAEILGAGGSARAHIADVTDFAAVSEVAAAVLAEHPAIQVLVNNVGDYRPLHRFRESSPESWTAMYDINLFHMFAVTRVFLESMIDGGGGCAGGDFNGETGGAVGAAFELGGLHRCEQVRIEKITADEWF